VNNEHRQIANSILARLKDGEQFSQSAIDPSAYEIQETLRQSEARDWIRRYKKKVMEEGKAEAWSWWQKTLSDLVKKRGQPAV
jgi:hypothetical protein